MKLIAQPKRGAVIVPTRSGKCRVNYYGKNYELLAQSEVLETKRAAQTNIRAMKSIFNDTIKK